MGGLEGVLGNIAMALTKFTLEKFNLTAISTATYSRTYVTVS